MRKHQDKEPINREINMARFDVYLVLTLNKHLKCVLVIPFIFNGYKHHIKVP